MNYEINSKPLMLVKLGGSIITDDQKLMTSKDDTISSILLLISEFVNEYQFVIVHGAGSFGHPLAKKYQLTKGFQSEQQRLGMVMTHNAMLKLNNILMNIGSNLGLKLFSFPPLVSVITKKGRINEWDLNSMGFALEQGFIPVTFGDVVFDIDQQFSILSGDQIVPYLAENLLAKKIVMLTDVQGVYSKNPKIDPTAHILNEINVLDKKTIGEIFSTEKDPSGKVRVTGEMGKKLDELIPVLKNGIETYVLSGLDTEYFRSYLEQKKLTLGTKLVAK